MSTPVAVAAVEAAMPVPGVTAGKAAAVTSAPETMAGPAVPAASVEASTGVTSPMTPAVAAVLRQSDLRSDRHS